ncbi:MAG: GNAT family N-acetyltransferase [Euryarchaeota archaeon]|jgi:predicted GNAT superfamily acetyltransferase|nr:GNAT family N-acetyltransferase [Euryarchaeota archaeon]MBT4981593.1 GNAT family N-acetyltransferase [Euryarchaeota archaeon]MBT5184143.1 GNAT family N-acetyltransferase [Euryarchaeota archaeon]
MEFRSLVTEDIPSVWRINEEGLPGTGKVSEEEIATLLELSELSLGAYEGGTLLGFVICLLPETEYGSLNYAWFNQKFQQFLYVDRIAVTAEHRSRKIGSSLYAKVFFEANRLRVPVAAEVSLEPPNPGSMRFHFRHEFQEVGVLRHESKSVTMMMRPHQKI